LIELLLEVPVLVEPVLDQRCDLVLIDKALGVFVVAGRLRVGSTGEGQFEDRNRMVASQLYEVSFPRTHVSKQLT
jgi:hypothetical protein